jgi:glucokinase
LLLSLESIGLKAKEMSTTIGVDIGGTKILALALSSEGKILLERRISSPPRSKGPGALFEGLEAVCKDLLSSLIDDGISDIGAVGIGAPGLIDRNGVMSYAPNLLGAVRVELRTELERRLEGIPVVVDNDATLATIAEHLLGAGGEALNLVMVTLGTGIGGGIVSDGKIRRGAHGFAGEVGHMVVVRDGILCTCGNHGCWEQYASGSALGRIGREAAVRGRAKAAVAIAGGDPTAVTGEHVTAAALDGDRDSIELLEEVGSWLGLGLSNLANLLDPDILVVGGGLIEAGELLLRPATATFQEMLEGGRMRPKPPIVAATLGERAGAIGAALIARENPPLSFS